MNVDRESGEPTHRLRTPDAARALASRAMQLAFWQSDTEVFANLTRFAYELEIKAAEIEAGAMR